MIAMKRQGQYGDPSSNAYVPAQMHNISGQRMETKPGNYEGQLEAFTPERENPSTMSKPEVQWRWELVESNISNSMTSRIHNEGQGGDGSRFQGHRQDPKLVLQNQSNNDARSQAREEDMDVGYEDLPQTFEGLEKKFRDDIMKLAKEQNTAEDGENARHRERITAIGTQYQEKLAALRAQHVIRRDEFLRRESHARLHQYQQSIRGPNPSSGGMAPSAGNASASASASAAVGAVQRGFGADRFDPYRERARFLGGGRGQGFEPSRGPGPYPGGRVYDTGSRYYK